MYGYYNWGSYAAGKDDGMRIIIKYGIACYKKECHVLSGD